MRWSHATLQVRKKNVDPNSRPKSTVRGDDHSVPSTIDLEIVNAQVLVLVPEWSAKANRDHEEPQPTHEAVDANVPVGITPIQPVLEDAQVVALHPWTARLHVLLDEQEGCFQRSQQGRSPVHCKHAQ